MANEHFGLMLSKGIFEQNKNLYKQNGLPYSADIKPTENKIWFIECI